MIGHNGHPEVEGTVGQLKIKKLIVEDENQDKLDFDSSTDLAFVTQTTYPWTILVNCEKTKNKISLKLKDLLKTIFVMLLRIVKTLLRKLLLLLIYS